MGINMKKTSIVAVVALCLAATSCEDFLTRENPNSIESEFFFTDESSLKLYSNGLLRSYSTAIMDFINGDRYSDTQNWDGEYLFYTDRYTIKESTSWSWTALRSINYYLENMRKAEAPAAVLDHYEGVGKVFRALFYFDKLQTFGAVPWYDFVIDSQDKDALYKDRDSRSEVFRHIFDDLEYACEHCSGDAAYRNRSNYINKYVALALKSRICLFEGTYRKYHPVDPSTGQAWTAAEKEDGEKYLREASKACEAIMSSGIYSLTDDPAKRKTQYRDMFICADACGSYMNEIIWAKDYNSELDVNNKSYSINDYMINAQHANYSFNRDFVMTYLNLDGTPFTSKYSGKDYYKATFAEECTGRDYRLAQTIRTPGFTRSSVHYAPDLVYAKTGYQPCKWLTDDLGRDEINSATDTDVPLIRYAEVLLNYAEAKAELGECTPDVWNKTIKPLRERAGVKSIYPQTADPYMVEYFLGSVTDPILLEIRRERGTELTMENMRQRDIRRWHMGELLVKAKTGIWIPALDVELDLDGDGVNDNIVSAVITEKPGLKVLTVNHNGSSKSGAGHILSEGDHGYIITNTAIVEKYRWEEKKYLMPVPASSITFNDGLSQNYGWTE